MGPSPWCGAATLQAWWGGLWCPEDASELRCGLAAAQSWGGGLPLQEGSRAACQGGQVQGVEPASWQLGGSWVGLAEGTKGKAPGELSLIRGRQHSWLPVPRLEPGTLAFGSM